MLLTTLLVLTTLVPRLEGPAREIRPEFRALGAAWPSPETVAPVFPTFQPEARAVSNWRIQAGESLRPASLALVARYASVDPAFVARCVKLNNYWCIKRARWNGEIGGDAEGHTGFATAADGADAAAQLLRRYYREYGRRTALAIVRRWAPAECRVGGTALPARVRAPAVSTDLAPRGIGRTPAGPLPCAQPAWRRAPCRRRVAGGGAAHPALVTPRPDGRPSAPRGGPTEGGCR